MEFVFSEPEDVLQYDDGVVDEQSDTQCQTAQGHDIQIDIEQMKQDKGRDDGYGNRQSDIQRTANIVQEEEKDDEG